MHHQGSPGLWHSCLGQHRLPECYNQELLCRFGGLPAVADNALEAMGPVLESVLGSLTQEYEKRLLAKDHEVKAAQQQLATIRHELAEARELAAENARLLPAPEIHPGVNASLPLN